MAAVRRPALRLLCHTLSSTPRRQLPIKAHFTKLQCLSTQCRSSLSSRPQFSQNQISYQPRRWRHDPTSSPETSRSKPSTVENQQYDFAQIKELIASPSKERILIDVREPAEYSAGFIPTALNIPVKTQPDSMFLTPDEFADRFGFAKPDPAREVIFYCRSGVRSGAMAQLARQAGYKDVSEYKGSWLDWTKNGGPEEKP